MSDEARAYVKRYSPYSGSTFWVHYVMGDIANKENDYEIWAGNEHLKDQWPLSDRAIDRARSCFIEDGFLTLLARPSPGNRARYRFEFLRVPENGRCPELTVRFPQDETLANLADVESVANLASHVCQSGESRLPKARSSPLTNRSRTEVELLPSANAAKAILDAFWQTVHPKPTAGYVAILKRIEECIEAGHSADAIANALPTMPAYSRNCFDYALRKPTVSGVDSNQSKSTKARQSVIAQATEAKRPNRMELNR